MTTAIRKQRYLDLMSAFPTGVAVVTSLDADGKPRGMTCSSITSATVVPPTLLVCLRIGSGTFDAVASNGRFAVNLLHEGGQPAAEVFSCPDRNRFSQVSWRPSRSGLPWLVQDAFAVAECQVTDFVKVGDHAVVLGEVSAIAQITGTPLLYGLRRFASWPRPVAVEQRPATQTSLNVWEELPA
jgi:flavin reductase (DIM6/NTAB) family NADH-FMN oxidoreductase RutF